MYKIRRSKNGLLYRFSGRSLIILTIITIFWINLCIRPILVLFGIVHGEQDMEHFVGVIIMLIPTSLLSVLDFKMLKIYFTKRLKENGKGTIKKLKIFSIEEMTYSSKGLRARGDSFNGYFLQVKDGDTIYCSDGIKKSNVEEVLLDCNLPKIYKSYGFEYDEKETHKKEVLHEIDNDIFEIQNKLEVEGFFKNMFSKKELAAIKREREFVETGYQTPYLIINGHKISVGDSVDIYIDSDNEKNYRMDIDFLLNK